MGYSGGSHHTDDFPPSHRLERWKSGGSYSGDRRLNIEWKNVLHYVKFIMAKGNEYSGKIVDRILDKVSSLSFSRRIFL